MKYVLDASVAYKWVVPEIDSDKALRLRENFRNAIDELVAPGFFVMELAHSLTRAERIKPPVLKVGQAEALWLDVMTTPPMLVPSITVGQRAIQIASAAQISSYDSAYIALAEREQCEFVTADLKLVNNMQTRFPFIRLLATFP
jgi:predicted nucleic acid-binding protein